MNSKRITVAACGMFIMLGFIAGGFSELREYKKEKQQKEAETFAAEESIREEEMRQERYVLKIEDGIVVVFNERDMTRPIIVTDIYASTLRHSDKEELTRGIVVNGDFELYSLIEDFSV